MEKVIKLHLRKLKSYSNDNNLELTKTISGGTHPFEHSFYKNWAEVKNYIQSQPELKDVELVLCFDTIKFTTNNETTSVIALYFIGEEQFEERHFRSTDEALRYNVEKYPKVKLDFSDWAGRFY